MSVNSHIEHVEDLIFEGSDGPRKAIRILSEIRDYKITVKWDGAPSIFVGIDPRDNKFFISKKSIFNKNPKVYKSEDEILSDLSGDLQEKFLIAFQEFFKLRISKGIYQGDLMFTRGDLKKEKIDGEPHLTFHPNTIVYAHPIASELGDALAQARIGVIWHTSYSGEDFTNLEARYCDSIDIGNVRSIWQCDPTFSAQISLETYRFIDDITFNANDILRTIPDRLFQCISNPEVVQRIKVFNNMQIREFKSPLSPDHHVLRLFQYIERWYDDQIDKKKSEKGKNTWKEKKQNTMGELHSMYASFESFFEVMDLLVEAKNAIIRDFNKSSLMKTFIRTKGGLKPTSPEGYVLTDHDGNVVKLVNRLEFSRANFSSEVIKGWECPIYK